MKELCSDSVGQKDDFSISCCYVILIDNNVYGQTETNYCVSINYLINTTKVSFLYLKVENI